MEQYIQQMGDEKAKKFFEDIKDAAEDSLEKFFILQKVCDLLVTWKCFFPVLKN